MDDENIVKEDVVEIQNEPTVDPSLETQNKLLETLQRVAKQNEELQARNEQLTRTLLEEKAKKNTQYYDEPAQDEDRPLTKAEIAKLMEEKEQKLEEKQFLTWLKRNNVDLNRLKDEDSQSFRVIERLYQNRDFELATETIERYLDEKKAKGKPSPTIQKDPPRPPQTGTSTKTASNIPSQQQKPEEIPEKMRNAMFSPDKSGPKDFIAGALTPELLAKSASDFVNYWKTKR